MLRSSLPIFLKRQTAITAIHITSIMPARISRSTKKEAIVEEDGEKRINADRFEFNPKKVLKQEPDDDDSPNKIVRTEPSSKIKSESSEVEDSPVKSVNVKKRKATTIKKEKPPKRAKFDYSLDFSKIDFKEHPKLYRIGKGEQGVLSMQPYKGEILPFWRFKTPEIAQESAEKIYQMFLDYKKDKDFPGADMARKFLMMGWTRSRRYANHPSGRKYSDEDLEDAQEKIDSGKIDPEKILSEETGIYKDPRNRRHALITKTKKILPKVEDPVKAQSAVIFKKYYEMARDDEEYIEMTKKHILDNEQ
ncbi:selenocysteine insertion sequence-binding protein 2 [Acrasis kona]|uniref:Selenocysteine insertion sequence-binding protein 2 n=1 Tax=Acrasis kona TaxID=1008807 RepID=A0AAW2Z874_9EUKA